MRMRLVLAGLIVAVMVVSAGPASAAQGNNTVDGSLILGTAPASGLDMGIGVGAGLTFDISDRMRSSNAKLAIRADLSYLNFDGDYFGVGISYSRLMLFGGPRFYLGGSKGGPKPFVEGGLEFSHDSYDIYVLGLGKRSVSDTNFGLAGGGGVEIPLQGNLKLSFSGRLHLITDDFLSIAATLGTSF